MVRSAALIRIAGTAAVLTLAHTAAAQNNVPNQGITPAPATMAAPAQEPSLAAPAPVEEPNPAAAPAGGGFNTEEPASRLVVSVAPYAWLTSFNGTTKIQNIELDVDLSFTDILDESESILAFMGFVDVQYDRLVLQFNGAYSQADFEQGLGVLPSGATVLGQLDTQLGWYEFMGGYRFVDAPVTDDPASRRRWYVDGFVGGRYTDLNADVRLSNDQPVTLPDGSVLVPGTFADRSASRDWWELFFGARAAVDITDNWSLSLRADLGGFGIDDADLSWQVIALAGYRWQFENWSLAAFGGYRALSQDYAEGAFAWDVTTHGPLLGVQASIPF
jgi:hypothetical protein